MRDFLLGKLVSDVDFTTDARPEQVKDMFSRVIPTGIQFGTVTVIFGAHSFEITSFRTEGKYRNFRSPDSVKFTPTLEEDLLRRDFTINAIALDPLREILIDIFDGRTDIEKKIIRCVGNPEKRLQEDALRILRGLRFSSTLNFTIEKNSFQAMQKHSHLVQHISSERIWEELHKIMNSESPDTGLALLRSTLLFRHIFSFELDEEEFLQAEQKLKLSRKKEGIVNLDAQKNLFCLRCACCFFSKTVDSSKTASILKKLRASRFEQDRITSILHYGSRPVLSKTGRPWSDFKLHAFLHALGREKLQLLLHYYKLRILSQGEQNKQSVYQHILECEKNMARIADSGCFSLKQLAIGGGDIQKRFPQIQGAAIGQALKTALRFAMQHPQNNTKTLLLHYLEECLE